MEIKDKVLQTGTTTVGVVCKDGVVLASESQATMGYLVASTEAPKVHKITDEIAITMAGAVADCQAVIRQLKALASLREIELDRKVTVKSIANIASSILFQNRYYPLISQLIIGGVDKDGPSVFSLDPLGSLMEEKKFTATGSGSVMAYGVLEEDYSDKITVKNGLELVKKAISASRKRDIGSGGKLQICTVTMEKGFKLVE